LSGISQPKRHADRDEHHERQDERASQASEASAQNRTRRRGWLIRRCGHSDHPVLARIRKQEQMIDCAVPLRRAGSRHGA